MKPSQNRPIVVMAGGTGGHVFPALAVAVELRRRGETIVWLGTEQGIEARLVPAAEFAIEWLDVQGIRGKSFIKTLTAPLILLRACVQAFLILLRLKPKAVLGMGGFVSGPGGLASWILRIPLFIHEQNSIIGMTNRWLSRFATRGYFAFNRAMPKGQKFECIGNPVRAEFLNLPKPEFRLAGRIGQPLRILVIGGSLGAARLNREIPQALSVLDVDDRPEVRHQCGPLHLDDCRQAYQSNRVEADISPFIDDIKSAYLWADLVICRSGALTVAELAVVGVASILVPYPYAVDNHQYWNAVSLSSVNAAEIMEENDLDADTLASKILHFQQDRQLIFDLAIKARSMAQPDAAERLASGILAGVIS
ncbi:MAG: UDP-N-acetylglucosamine--N-acetylmuramyl-(pentapeptide) pyrophosphoryl-undecaprenol N-acetylglucosamine transferase [Gammaproteobacteria bacterium]|jgi:UDP-N-acetylglucosamine--N-acetylmuramyl-(pentapeptide) pyrophosphoryl-undecaprenol N-acetylglucosamine transferase